MPSYKSNLKSVVNKLMKDLQQGVQNAVEVSVKEAAVDVAASNIRRLHNEGKAVDGSEIGDYKEGVYRNNRIKKGRRVDKVNLAFTGKLSKEFAPIRVAHNLYYVGFLTQYGTKMHAYQEERFGKKIWGATKEDEEVSSAIFDRNLKKTIREITK